MAAVIPPRELGKVGVVANLTASGVLCTAATVTDSRAVTVNQTTASLTFTLPPPTDAAVVSLNVINIGTVSFSLNGQVIPSSYAYSFTWTGTAWVARPPSSAVAAPSYTVANLPSTGNTVGALAFATNGRALNTAASLVNIAFETAGNGTGVLCSWNGTAWKVVATNSTVSA